MMNGNSSPVASQAHNQVTGSQRSAELPNQMTTRQGESNVIQIPQYPPEMQGTSSYHHPHYGQSQQQHQNHSELRPYASTSQVPVQRQLLPRTQQQANGQHVNMSQINVQQHPQQCNPQNGDPQNGSLQLRPHPYQSESRSAGLNQKYSQYQQLQPSDSQRVNASQLQQQQHTESRPSQHQLRTQLQLIGSQHANHFGSSQQTPYSEQSMQPPQRTASGIVTSDHSSQAPPYPRATMPQQGAQQGQQQPNNVRLNLRDGTYRSDALRQLNMEPPAVPMPSPSSLNDQRHPGQWPLSAPYPSAPSLPSQGMTQSEPRSRQHIIDLTTPPPAYQSPSVSGTSQGQSSSQDTRLPASQPRRHSGSIGDGSGPPIGRPSALPPPLLPLQPPIPPTRTSAASNPYPSSPQSAYPSTHPNPNLSRDGQGSVGSHPPGASSGRATSSSSHSASGGLPRPASAPVEGQPTISPEKAQQFVDEAMIAALTPVQSGIEQLWSMTVSNFRTVIDKMNTGFLQALQVERASMLARQREVVAKEEENVKLVEGVKGLEKEIADLKIALSVTSSAMVVAQRDAVRLSAEKGQLEVKLAALETLKNRVAAAAQELGLLPGPGMNNSDPNHIQRVLTGMVQQEVTEQMQLKLQSASREIQELRNAKEMAEKKLQLMLRKMKDSLADVGIEDSPFGDPVPATIAPPSRETSTVVGSPPVKASPHMRSSSKDISTAPGSASEPPAVHPTAENQASSSSSTSTSFMGSYTMSPQLLETPIERRRQSLQSSPQLPPPPFLSPRPALSPAHSAPSPDELAYPGGPPPPSSEEPLRSKSATQVGASGMSVSAPPGVPMVIDGNGGGDSHGSGGDSHSNGGASGSPGIGGIGMKRTRSMFQSGGTSYPDPGEPVPTRRRTEHMVDFGGTTQSGPWSESRGQVSRVEERVPPGGASAQAADLVHESAAASTAGVESQLVPEEAGGGEMDVELPTSPVVVSAPPEPTTIRRLVEHENTSSASVGLEVQEIRGWQQQDEEESEPEEGEIETVKEEEIDELMVDELEEGETEESGDPKEMAPEAAPRTSTAQAAVLPADSFGQRSSTPPQPQQSASRPRSLSVLPPSHPPMVKAERPRLGFKHLKLLYLANGNRWHCRLCRTLPTNPGAPRVTFPKETKFDVLLEHSHREHPVACADITKLSPASLSEMLTRLPQ